MLWCFAPCALVCAALLGAQAAAAGADAGAPPPGAPRAARLVLVTLDGVRWQDALHAAGAFAPAPVLAGLLARAGREGAVFGDRTQQSLVECSGRKPISLPGYMALFAGAPQPCADNECGQIGVETVLERLRRELRLPREQVALFASWEGLGRAAARDPAAILLDAPPRGQQPGVPWEDSRPDAETFARALAHYRRERPRVLAIAFGDPDEWAHAGEKERYLESIRAIDRWLGELLAAIDAAGPEVRGATTLLVTTDHGRGPGPFWTSHSRFDTARGVWLIALGAGVEPVGRARSRLGPLRHVDLRPTIERRSGLCPACAGESCGQPIPELLSGVVDPCLAGAHSGSIGK